MTTTFINEIHYDNVSSDVGEFVELAGLAGTSLNGWLLVLYNGTATQRAPYDTVDLSGITFGDESDGYGFETITFPADGIQNGAPDGLALVDANGAVVEFLSYEGSFEALAGPAAGLTSVDIGVSETGSTPVGFSLQRQGTGTVAADFTFAAPSTETPGAVNTNQSFGDEVDPPEPGDVTLISAVQGAGRSSPIDGTIVTVEAIVVGDFQDGAFGTDGELNGFYLQEEDADADGNAATSEGVFVFEGSSPSVDVRKGDLVRVSGTIDEFFGETQIDTVTSVEIVSRDNPLPTAATITFPVANTVTNSDGVLIADLEMFEGMSVTVPEELTVSDLFTLGRFGDVGLHADGRLPIFTQVNEPSVQGFEAYQDLAVRNTITLDDGSTVQNPARIPFDVASAPGDVAGQLDANDELRSGDTTTGLTGVVRFGTGSGQFGDEIYRINPTETPVFTNANPRPSAPDVGGTVQVASFNLLNFFTTLDDGENTSGPSGLDPRGAENELELERQTQKLVAALSEIGADVFGLIELENEFGDQNGDGVFAISVLVDELNEAVPGADYRFVDPGQGFIDTGDAISVGLIYDANTVALAEGTTVEILTDADLSGLGLDFGNPVFDGNGTSRAPLAATFEELASGETFTVTVNHFKSKGSISPFGNNTGIGDGTGNNNEARLQAATALDAWLDTDPTGSGDEDVLIIGDLNAYAREDPIRFLADEGYTDLEAAFSSDPFDYSFGFPVDLDTSPQVQAFGTLDYALANGSLSSQVTGADAWNINADEASVFDYNTNFKPPEQIAELFAPNAFRSSDHDPIIIGLDLESDTLVANSHLEFDVERLRIDGRNQSVLLAELHDGAADGVDTSDPLTVEFFDRRRPDDNADRPGDDGVDLANLEGVVFDNATGLGEAITFVSSAEARAAGRGETLPDDAVIEQRITLESVRTRGETVDPNGEGDDPFGTGFGIDANGAGRRGGYGGDEGATSGAKSVDDNEALFVEIRGDGLAGVDVAFSIDVLTVRGQSRDTETTQNLAVPEADLTIDFWERGDDGFSLLESAALTVVENDLVRVASSERFDAASFRVTPGGADDHVRFESLEVGTFSDDAPFVA